MTDFLGGHFLLKSGRDNNALLATSDVVGALLHASGNKVLCLLHNQKHHT